MIQQVKWVRMYSYSYGLSQIKLFCSEEVPIFMVQVIILHLRMVMPELKRVQSQFKSPLGKSGSGSSRDLAEIQGIFVYPHSGYLKLKLPHFVERFPLFFLGNFTFQFVEHFQIYKKVSLKITWGRFVV